MNTYRISVATISAILLLLSAALTSLAGEAPLKGEGRNLEIVANIDARGGTDVELATIKGRQYGFFVNGQLQTDIGPDGAAIRVIDMTNPEKPREVARSDCRTMPGNIEISHDNKFLYVTANGTAGPEGCLAEGRRGFLIVDIRNPRNPKTIAMADTGKAFSLVAAAHPTKPYVYDAAASVTNSDGQVQSNGEIRVWNVRNPKKPAVANTVATLPISGQQISFNSDGTKMVTAAVDRFEIFDTADVENPRLLWSGRCPGCSSIRDAKFTPDDRGVIVSDSAATGGVLPLCPVGALYFYQLQGEFLPVLTGSYKPAHLLWPGNEPSLGWCTSDAFDISPDGSRVAIAWRSMGVRHLDISGMAGLAFGEESIGEIKELGWFRPDGSMVLSATFLGEGKYIVSADMNRGFDIFKAKKTGTRVTSRSSEKRRMSVAKQLTR